MLDFQIEAPAPILPAPVVATGCAAPPTDDVVVCGRSDQEQFRLRPVHPPTPQQNVLERPHVLKLGPFRVGLLGHGRGVGLRAEF